ncbi:unnamed protein product [Brassica rapa subsp. trilocularis]
MTMQFLFASPSSSLQGEQSILLTSHQELSHRRGLLPLHRTRPIHQDGKRRATRLLSILLRLDAQRPEGDPQRPPTRLPATSVSLP